MIRRHSVTAVAECASTAGGGVGYSRLGEDRGEDAVQQDRLGSGDLGDAGHGHIPPLRTRTPGATAPMQDIESTQLDWDCVLGLIPACRSAFQGQ